MPRHFVFALVALAAAYLMPLAGIHLATGNGVGVVSGVATGVSEAASKGSRGIFGMAQSVPTGSAIFFKNVSQASQTFVEDTISPLLLQLRETAAGGVRACKRLATRWNSIQSPVQPRAGALPTSESLRLIINETCTKYGLEEALVMAVVRAESNFNPRAVSSKGARGLMQLMPATAQELGVSDSFNPAENIDGGVRYLKWLLGLFDNDTKLALAAYNAGPTKVRRYKGIPPYRETKRYVKRVLKFYDHYSG